MLGSAASSKRQIAPGRVRGRWGRDSLPLLPHSPSTTNEDLLCARSERSTRDSLQGAVPRAPVRDWEVALTVVGRLFVSQVGLPTGDLTGEKGAPKVRWLLGGAAA